MQLKSTIAYYTADQVSSSTPYPQELQSRNFHQKQQLASISRLQWWMNFEWDRIREAIKK